MKGYFDTIPVEIEEAAMIDGATQLEQVTKIVLRVWTGAFTKVRC